jgi:hypothetical protein
MKSLKAKRRRTSEMTNQLQLTVAGPIEAPDIELTPASFEARRMALALAEGVTEINSPEDAKLAAETYSTVKNLLRELESCRKAVKDPILAAGRKVDFIAKEFGKDLEAHGKRLSLLVGDYQDRERQKAEEARREAYRKEEAIKAELAAKERARIIEEGKGRTGTMLEDIEQLREEAIDKIAEAREEASQAADLQAGISVRKNWKFEVESMEALFEARPDLCVIEPNNAAIRAIIKASNGKAIPGLRIWSETPAIVRASAPSALPVSPAAYDY